MTATQEITNRIRNIRKHNTVGGKRTQYSVNDMNKLAKIRLFVNQATRTMPFFRCSLPLKKQKEIGLIS